MSTTLKSLLRNTMLLLFIGIGLSSCAGVSPTSSASPALLQQIESARTRADHEALASYYSKEASAARAIAADHRKMARSYQAMTVSGKGGGSMQAHCNSIVSKYEGVAADYESMASAHRDMAKQAQP